MAKTDPSDAVTETAMAYYRAMVAGDEGELRRLFDARAVMAGHFDGEFQWLDVDSFVAEAKSLVGQHGAEDCTIEAVRVDGDIATVAVRGRYAGLWFVDHLSMAEAGEHWVIVAKTFYVSP